MTSNDTSKSVETDAEKEMYGNPAHWEQMPDVSSGYETPAKTFGIKNVRRLHYYNGKWGTFASFRSKDGKKVDIFATSPTHAGYSIDDQKPVWLNAREALCITIPRIDTNLTAAEVVKRITVPRDVAAIVAAAVQVDLPVRVSVFDPLTNFCSGAALDTEKIEAMIVACNRMSMQPSVSLTFFPHLIGKSPHSVRYGEQIYDLIHEIFCTQRKLYDIKCGSVNLPEELMAKTVEFLKDFAAKYKPICDLIDQMHPTPTIRPYVTTDVQLCSFVIKLRDLMDQLEDLMALRESEKKPKRTRAPKKSTEQRQKPY